MARRRTEIFPLSGLLSFAAGLLLQTLPALFRHRHRRRSPSSALGSLPQLGIFFVLFYPAHAVLSGVPSWAVPVQPEVQADSALQCLWHAACKGRLKGGYWLCRQAAGRGAKAREAAKQSKADQREAKAEMLGPREDAGTALARRRARSLTKVAASVLQRPPSSRARTTSACIGQTAGAEGRCAP